MTDNEIIKALRCCADRYCKGCSEQNKAHCRESIAALACDLIYRQNEEIERLKKNNAERTDFHANLREAEKKKHKLLVKIAEQEAIKEFARRVKATFPPREDPHCTDDDIFTLDSIDRIMNDMLTESEDNT